MSRSHMTTRIRHALSSLAASSLLACGGGGSSPATAPATPPDTRPPAAAVTVAATPAIAFTPAHVKLVQGGTVTFAFGSVAHDVFFDDDPAGAPASIPGAVSNTSVARTFTTAGEYTFDCHIHPGMRGSVTVVAPDTL